MSEQERREVTFAIGQEANVPEIWMAGKRVVGRVLSSRVLEENEMVSGVMVEKGQCIITAKIEDDEAWLAITHPSFGGISVDSETAQILIKSEGNP